MKNSCSNNLDFEIIGHSQHLQDIREKIAYAAQRKETVLIEGERGTGKELIAQNIHYQGNRNKFLPVDCGAISPNLFESKFFGHKKGSFSGADQDKKGLVELANDGTLFLDEIGNLSKDHQSKLLRFLQDKSYWTLGGSQLKISNARIIAATNKNLDKEIANSNFFADLYDRLKNYVIRTLPLKERPVDTICLANHFIERDNLKVDNKIKFLLYSYELPGNVRDVENYLPHDYEYVRAELIRSWASQRGKLPETYMKLNSLSEVKNLQDQDKDDDLFIEAPYFLSDILNDPDDPDRGAKLINEIVEAYEIVTLKMKLKLNMEEMAKLLSIRKEKLVTEKFKDYFGFEFPKENDPLCAEFIDKTIYPHFVNFMGRKRGALKGKSRPKI